MKVDVSLLKDFLRVFISEIDQGVAIIDFDGKFEMYNSSFARIFNREYNELKNKRIIEVIPSFNKQYLGTKVIIFESLKRISISTLFIGKESTSEYYIVIVSEIAEHNEQMHLLLNEAFKEVLDNIDEGVMIVDSKNQIIYCNSVQLEFDGLKIEEVIGQHASEVYNFDPEISTLGKCLKKENFIGPYVQFYKSNGQFVRVTGNNFPVKYDNKLAGAVAIYRNLQISNIFENKLIELNKGLKFDQQDCDLVPVNNLADKKYFTFEDIRGNSTSILESISWARSAAKSDSSVFIYGETGTGKEMFAQSIHSNSNRWQKPFVSINCAAIPETLLEGIIFGTVKGAFTGAIDRKGVFEEADGGTLLLDEINSMPLCLQSKLLRALEERKIRRLGGKHEIPIDVRIISTCNVEPKEVIRQNLMRTDLYYRLAVINLEVPSLRERKEDVYLLAHSFVQYFNSKMKKNVCEISPEVLELLQSYDWPGNVRQLRNWIESAMNMVPEDEPVFGKKHLPRSFKSFMTTLKDEELKKENIFTEMREQEYTRVVNALKRHGGNITKAAKELGVSRQVLYYRMNKLGINR
ncbi:sigma 54-interacting transcriptional regulator [Desulfosporosinus sp. FKB]|uniref:sigma 54-interacting transcriptional regulator n=1 Tax=Desulfosporosinus sp. FKB TaxID=1969835 RepID=UPI000B4A0DAF|nr:sigma 54-interacting transcriptional regulator [Desulfosporosinus sp. FKB]